MMASLRPVKVAVVIDRVVNEIQCSEDCTAEKLCTILCMRHNIPPLTRTLFGLRIKGKDDFLKDSQVLDRKKEYELRIRYKVPRLGHLITLDETTFDYYFQQARNDVNNSKIPEIKYPDSKEELLGLGIIDMARAVQEEKLPRKDVESNYRKYVPKVIVKKHGPFVKKYAEEYLPRLCSVGHDVDNLKSLYLQGLYALAPNYLAEEYNVLWKSGNSNGRSSIPVRLIVAPFHQQMPGIRMYNTQEREWLHVCPIEELIYLTRNVNCSLEVSRRGTPLFFTFTTEDQLSSFISVCDGYYRLMVKWTFNLSKDDESPSLKRLQRMKCHGPVGGAFSYRKLDEKRGKTHGCYVLRECQDDYDVYYLDVCTKNRTTETYRIEFHGRCWLFNDMEYDSLESLIKAHQKPDEKIFLNECIPPSEYDKSQLLLCGEPQKTGVRVEQAELHEILKENKSPRCLPNKDILLYTGSEKVGFENITTTYKALWKLDETKKLLVAFKTLQRDKANDYLKDFIELANKWACVQSSSIVRLYGITLSSPTALVLEYLPYGPFNAYLKENADTLTNVDLLRVAAGLTRALWDLSECGVVHGDIRCRRLLLAAHDEYRIVVKLAGPSIRHYTAHDVHWIPVEYYSDMNLAKRSVLGDIWAFATTVWEIYSYGQSPNETNPVLTAKSYEKGQRLPKPAACPFEVWRLLLECWTSESLALRPQAIMRDINYLLNMEDAQRIDPYSSPLPISNDIDGTITTEPWSEPSVTGSHKSLISVDSSVASVNGTMTTDYDSRSVDNGSDYNVFGNRPSLPTIPTPARSPSVAGLVDPDGSFVPSLMQSIISQGKTYLVTKIHKIGSGNYGDVYRGMMESDSDRSKGRTVAIKTLRSSSVDAKYKEFKNELDIMKSLHHDHIVEILGFSNSGPEVLIVMEYLEEGSLNNYLNYNKSKLRMSHLLKYALDIASGMDHISAKNIVHRDLATRNILVVNRNNVKISDFGLARMLPREETEYKVKTERHLPFNWYAPESVVAPWQFSTKSDVWSYGVTVWEMFTFAKVQVPKFDLTKPLERASCFGIPDKCPEDIYRYLMMDCWAQDPNRRPRFIDLVHTCRRLQEEYSSSNMYFTNGS